MAWLSDEIQHQEARIDALKARYEQLHRLSTPSDGDHVLHRLQGAVRRRRARFNALSTQIRDLNSERDRLETEVMRCLQGIEALLLDLVEDLEAATGPCWSPTPVTGFTSFVAIEGAMHDGDHVWASNTLNPACPRWSGATGPHESEDCVQGGCGVHVFKSFREVPAPTGSCLTAIAEVALHGRVVEHSEGYRGAVGVVTALIAFDENNWIRTRTTDEIAQLMSTPDASFAASRVLIPANTMMYLEADAYLVNG